MQVKCLLMRLFHSNLITIRKENNPLPPAGLSRRRRKFNSYNRNQKTLTRPRPACPAGEKVPIFSSGEIEIFPG